MRDDHAWPALPLAPWRDTRETLHRWTQIVGKLRLALAPPEPEWGHVPLTVTARGLTTGALSTGDRAVQIDFDLVEHVLRIATSDGELRTLALAPRSVAAFYDAVTRLIAELGIDVRIHAVPDEVSDRTPFAEDTRHASYDPAAVERFFRVLLRADEALRVHRAPFRGRHTQVQFFWGTFDLAYTRYSGRPATPPPGVDAIGRGAMDAELIEAGFWAGDDRFPEPAFFGFGFPKPDGLEQARVTAPGFWSTAMGEYLLPYEAVRTAADPRAVIATFLAQTYAAGARLGGWDAALIPS
jgi:hypothetical protein